MVALLVVAIVLCALTADYFVQRLALRAPASRAVSDAAEGYFLNPDHLWIHPEPSGLASVGTDNVIGVLLGRPRRIDWSPAGQVKRGAPLAVIHGQGRSLTVRSPVDGEVVEQNTQLPVVAAPAASEALDTGWLVRLRPAALAPSLASTRAGKSLREWSREEMERLRAFVLSRLPTAAVGATAADGGPLAADLASRLDDDAWNEAVRLMLGKGAAVSPSIPDLQSASAGGQS